MDHGSDPQECKRARLTSRTAVLLLLTALVACARPPLQRSSPSPEVSLAEHCETNIGSPRVEALAPGLFLAIGYDLASTILIQTSEGNIVIDAAMSPARARPIREALDEVAPGPVRALIFTHSHIDHVGGASVWVEEGTEVWATETFESHFFKQYGMFFQAEGVRGFRQFGQDIPNPELPCSALGRSPDVRAALDQGVVLPTHTFRDHTVLTVGDVTLELHEAHGETHDQLFVWWPERKTLLPGDNWYRAFPNLYTIRGSAPRPVRDWIRSLDRMRALEPELMVPSHTRPVIGTDAVQTELTAYRDAIQWVHDEVVRGANAGTSLDELAASITLPPHLAAHDALTERYGTVPWSVRAIYTNELGWFDGRAANLLTSTDRAQRTIELAGGTEAVLSAAQRAVAAGDAAWALHLADLLRSEGTVEPRALATVTRDALTALGHAQPNSNARGYLLTSAQEWENGPLDIGEPTMAGDFIERIPLEQLLDIMATRLRPEHAAVHETLEVRFTDLDKTAFLTVRHGVLEVRWGTPLTGTPAPIGALETTSGVWRELALGTRAKLGAIVSGDLAVRGSPLAVQRFLGRFNVGVKATSSTPP